jgi:hypothetical protein
MLLGHTDQARKIYFGYHGKRMSQKRRGQDAIKEDFETLRQAGYSHRLMTEVEKRFAAAKWDEALGGTPYEGSSSSAIYASGTHDPAAKEQLQVPTSLAAGHFNRSGRSRLRSLKR